jgi:hypothetical protein
MTASEKRLPTYAATSMTVDRRDWPSCEKRRNRSWPGVVFESLIDQHAKDPENGDAIERAIFSKLIDYRRDVKRRLVSGEEQERMRAKIAEYTAQVRRSS